MEGSDPRLPQSFVTFFSLISMATLLENFVSTHPDFALSHTTYGQYFHLGNSVNILSSPGQQVHSFIESEGAPYRFMIVGQLLSFKVVEDAVNVVFFILFVK